MPPGLRIRESAADHPSWDGSWKYHLSIEGFVIESWSQGFMVGSLIIMAGLTIANMRADSLLHKLILIELLLGMCHGTFCFMEFPGYGWYVSSTAVALYSSWYLHNIIAWLKTRPFLRPLHSRIYIATFLCTTPFWVLETYGNYTFNNNIGQMFLRTRPFEALCRDPWWIFTIVNLLYNMKRRYDFGYIRLIRTSPRFGVMLVSMFLSIVFMIMDILSATVKFGQLVGINPYWKLSLVFKCFCDTIILDDFRSALEKIRAVYFRNLEHGAVQHSGKAWPEQGGTRRTSSFHSSFPKQTTNVFNPKVSVRSDRPPRWPNRMLSGLFDGSRRDADADETNRIHVSTDIVMDHQTFNGPDGRSCKSSMTEGGHHETAQ